MNALFGDVEGGHLFVDMVRGLGFRVQGILGKGLRAQEFCA